jgi:hypothetical protein
MQWVKTTEEQEAKEADEEEEEEVNIQPVKVATAKVRRNSTLELLDMLKEKVHFNLSSMYDMYIIIFDGI